MLERSVKNAIKSGKTNIDKLFSLAAEEIYKEYETPTESDQDLEGAIADIQQRDQQGQGLRILQPKQLITRLPVLMAQVRAGNNSKSLLNEIQQIAYSLLRSRHITKKVYNKILRFVKGNTYK